MKITANEEYGLRIILRIAKIAHDTEVELVSLSAISSAEGITPEYTASIITLLKNAHLVNSVRGKKGGYLLSRSPYEISLSQIINALSDKPFANNFCDSHAGVLERCIHSKDCSIRPVWNLITSTMDELFSKISLADLIANEDKVAFNIQLKQPLRGTIL
jgi:Rrf2 family protein